MTKTNGMDLECPESQLLLEKEGSTAARGGGGKREPGQRTQCSGYGMPAHVTVTTKDHGRAAQNRAFHKPSDRDLP